MPENQYKLRQMHYSKIDALAVRYGKSGSNLGRTSKTPKSLFTARGPLLPPRQRGTLWLVWKGALSPKEMFMLLSSAKGKLTDLPHICLVYHMSHDFHVERSAPSPEYLTQFPPSIMHYANVTADRGFEIFSFQIFTIARYCHTIVYVAKIRQPFRGLAFFAGLIVNAYMTIQIIKFSWWCRSYVQIKGRRVYFNLCFLCWWHSSQPG